MYGLLLCCSVVKGGKSRRRRRRRRRRVRGEAEPIIEEECQRVLSDVLNADIFSLRAT